MKFAHNLCCNIMIFSIVQNSSRFKSPFRPFPPFRVRSVTDNQVLPYWTQVPLSSQCTQQAQLHSYYSGAADKQRLNLYWTGPYPSHRLATFCEPSFPTCLQSTCWCEGPPTLPRESWRCEGQAEFYSRPPPQRLIPLDTVPGGQLI